MDTGGIRIGTCSWTDRSLIESGSFYPPEVESAGQRLRFYAGFFDTVEVDASYFAIPTLHMSRAWAERTPERFLFHIRAFGALTGHNIETAELPKELRALLPACDRARQSVHVQEPDALRGMAGALIAALEPLRAARKLGFIVCQFPPWFGYSHANRDYLLYLKTLLAGLPIAVEFRHGSWLTHRHADELFAFLREHRITYITCDEPQFGSLVTPPFLPEATTPIAYLRLHGRNVEAWLDRPELRYNYSYDASELKEFAAEVWRLRERARTVFVMFRNCHAGQAVKNAGQLQALLEGNQRQIFRSKA